ncbi:MAG: peroxiredoxin [Labilithrix sp.]|nr:peroxiredoxin [Labilithrix sp.]MBX3224250.1 peroxiredoxin [Labilithrix sp.]
MALRIGQKAPDFDVTSSSGTSLKLSDFIGKKNVVLYFYPGDFTLVCTRETCGFRDRYAELAGTDTEVIGVSVDSDETHQRFAKEYNVPFSLVSDANKSLAARYEATGFLSRLMGKTGRITYVIDKNGYVAGVFDSVLRASHHVDGVRDLVRKLG